MMGMALAAPSCRPDIHFRGFYLMKIYWIFALPIEMDLLQIGWDQGWFIKF